MKKIAMLSVIALVLTGCFSPWQGDTGTLSISFGGGKSRAILSEQTNSDELTHIITVTDSAGTIHHVTLQRGGKTASFSSLALGTCTIEVKGYLTIDIQGSPEEKLKTEGRSEINIKPGHNSKVINNMQFIGDGNGTYDLPSAAGLYLGAPDTLTSDSTPIEVGYLNPNNINEAFGYVNSEPGTYTLLIDEDLTNDYNSGHQTLMQGMLTIIGIRSVTINSNFTINPLPAGTTLTLGNNISLSVTATTSVSGTLIMKEGSAIEGTINGSDSLIKVNTGGTFIMEGGKISGSTKGTVYNACAGVSVSGANSTFTMSGGKIDCKRSSNVQADIFIDHTAGTFTLSGNADVSAIMLGADIDVNATITVDTTTYTGNTTINLWVSVNVDLGVASNYWLDRTVIKNIDGGPPLTATDVNKFKLGTISVYSSSGPITGRTLSQAGSLGVLK